MNKKVVIFLTGTIHPNNVPNLKRISPLDREQDYYLALKKWMRLNIPIIFVESSGYYSKLLEGLFNGRPDCEYITFEGTQGILGKSHGEAEIIKHAFGISEQLNSSDIVLKASGRQFIINAENILRYFIDQDTYTVVWLKQFLQYADSRFFLSCTDFYISYLMDELENINESNLLYLEHILARAVHKSMGDGKKWLLPNEYPLFSGISGTNNIKYKNNLYNNIKGNIILRLTHRMLKNDFL